MPDVILTSGTGTDVEEKTVPSNQVLVNLNVERLDLNAAPAGTDHVIVQTGTDDPEKALLSTLLEVGGAPSEITVATGVLAVSAKSHKVQPETSTTDDITSITGMSTGQFCFLVASDAGTDTLTFVHDGTSISCLGGYDVKMSEGAVLLFSFDGTEVKVASTSLNTADGTADNDFLLWNNTTKVYDKKTVAEVLTALGVDAGADVTGDNAPQAHKTSHTDGSDDIQSATTVVKGVATATQIIALEAATAAQHTRAHSITGTSDHNDVTDKYDTPLSPMILTGGAVSEGVNAGTFEVSALTALVRATNATTGALTKITLAKQENQAITAANTTYFVSLNYNGGSASLTLLASSPYVADKRSIPIGMVMKDSSDNVHFISAGYDFADGVQKLHTRIKTVHGIELANGSTIAYSGTNNFTMEAGTVYAGINTYALLSYDSASTQFIPVYSDGGAGFTEGAASNVIDFANYDGGAGSLVAVGNNKFSVFWVYRHVDDGHVYVRYGEDSYAFAEAEDSEEPTKPTHLTDFGVLIGRIIVPQAGGSFAAVSMSTTTMFGGVGVGDHGNLGGLTDDDHPQYLLLSRGTDVASATALPLIRDGNYTVVTGTTTITSINTVRVGDARRLHFDGILTLTHHATDLYLPTEANITTAAGDEAVFVEYATGDWRCVNYQRADGTALACFSVIHHVFIPAGAMTPRDTNGAEPDTNEYATNDVMLDRYLFDSATEEGVSFQTALDNWAGGTVKFKPVWTADAGSGNAVWGFSGIALDNDNAIDQAFGSEVTSTDTLTATGDADTGPATAAMTFAGTGTPADGDMLIVQVVAKTSGTIDNDIALVGVWLEYTEAAAALTAWA